MELSFSRLEEDIARFTMKDATPAFVNSFRRTMIGEVPTLAIEDVIIYDNNSALFDEMLAHRLGLIPIKTDLTEYVKRSECTCGGEGCSSCQAVFTLSVEGPGMVHSSDLIPADTRAVPVNMDIPIVKLEKDQKIVLEARAEINIGTEHAKWEPTLACGYKAYPVIKIEDNCDGCGNCVEECPRGILRTSKNSIRVADGKLEECSMCRLCEKACMASGIGEKPAINVKPDTTRFLFVVESDGSLPVKEIMTVALGVMKGKADSLVDVLNEISGAI